MSEDFNYLFQYLEKENIYIDKTEFLFQIQSHPDYPSLLAVADTLTFFNIENGAIKVSFEEIESLPNLFVAILRNENHSQNPNVVEKSNESLYLLNGGKFTKISKDVLKSRWTGTVFLVEKEHAELKIKKQRLKWALPILFSVCFLIIIFQSTASLSNKLFFIFPTLGVLFSIATLKDLFGAKNNLINSFCNITTSTSCTAVVNSKKWRIFEVINFSDLSIIFFTSQFLGLFTFLLLGESNLFLNIQEILLFCSFPIIIVSIYFQKFIEKKWCPICLIIIIIMIMELTFLISINSIDFKIHLFSLLLFGFILLFTVLTWNALKYFLSTIKKLKEFRFKANRFARNYKLFKNNLLAENKIEQPDFSIVLGNKEASKKITLITDPFCGYCKEVHEIIEKIIENYGSKIQINVIIKVSINHHGDEAALFYRSLLNIYFEKGEIEFREALNYWFKNKDLKKWLNRYKSDVNNNEKIDLVYNNLFSWCMSNGYNYTPAIFINGYEYPKNYDRENLEFYIAEIIEDNY